MENYRLEVYDNSDNLLAIFDKAFSIKITEELNKGGRFDFSLVGKDAKTTFTNISGRNYIKFYRNDTLIWSGKIMSSSIVLDGNGQTISNSCLSWFNLLQYRIVSKTYSATDAGAIAWDLIDTIQGDTYGSLGIIEGTIEATTDRDRTYENDNVLNAIQNLTNCENGFDFEITPSKVFNAVAFRGTDKSDDIVLRLDYNVKKIDLKIDHGSVANYVKAIGNANLTKTATDTDSQAYFGQRDKVLTEINWLEEATIQDHANEWIRAKKWSSYDIQVDLMPNVYPDFADWEIGDIVKVKALYGDLEYDQNVRIYGYDLAIDKDGAENIGLRLNQIP